MAGMHGQLTTSELDKALAATGTLLELEPCLDRLTFVHVRTLDTDLKAEQDEREQARAQAVADARATAAALPGSPVVSHLGPRRGIGTQRVEEPPGLEPGRSHRGPPGISPEPGGSLTRKAPRCSVPGGLALCQQTLTWPACHSARPPQNAGYTEDIRRCTRYG